jgi:KUP system potassium uptake protein
MQPAVSTSPPPGAHAPRHTGGGHAAKLMLGALGVVYGDIGTSPLYAMRECVTAPHGVAPSTANVLGILSLIFWSLAAVVTFKYLWFVLRADNRGEGGVLALLALAVGTDKGRRALVLLGLFGAALLYGDGIITPAITVLSAVEGLGVATQAFTPFVVPLTCGILIALFVIQRRGTGGIGAIFGPATLIWFIAIAASGLPWVVRRPDILVAVNPLHAARFLIAHGKHGFLVLGSVVLCVTGGEALYADMGHFGAGPIRRAWYVVVMPALLINYFGQGALLLQNPASAANPFYEMVPRGWLYPMVVIATVASVVASQALISGAFSLTRQAVQLGYWPRVRVVHTSGRAEGQIYIPEINWLLLLCCLALVAGFKSSDRLASAYGIAVTGTMAITTLLFYFVVRTRWRWSAPRALLLVSVFLVFDLSFLGANVSKFLDGGWVPVLVAAVVYTVMTTWKTGRALLAEHAAGASLPLKLFVEEIEANQPHRVAGTAVFMSSTRRGTPNVLLHHLKHNKVLHQQIVILSVVTDAVPEVPAADRLRVKSFGAGVWALTAHYGFMESPDVPAVLRGLRTHGLAVREHDCSYYLGRETLLLGGSGNMAGWRKWLFSFLSRNARPATDFFALPANRVVEMGAQIKL